MKGEERILLFRLLQYWYQVCSSTTLPVGVFFGPRRAEMTDSEQPTLNQFIELTQERDQLKRQLEAQNVRLVQQGEELARLRSEVVRQGSSQTSIEDQTTTTPSASVAIGTAVQVVTLSKRWLGKVKLADQRRRQSLQQSPAPPQSLQQSPAAHRRRVPSIEDAIEVIQRRTREWQRRWSRLRAMGGQRRSRTIRSLVEQLYSAPKEVVVFGSLNVDMSTKVNSLFAKRSLPGLSSPKCEPGGKGLNQAAAVVQLGVSTHLVGLIGRDPLGAFVTNYLDELSAYTPLNLDGVEIAEAADARVGLGMVVEGIQGERLTISCPGANMLVGEHEASYAVELLQSAHGERGRWVDILLVQLEVPLRATRVVLEAAQRRGRACSVMLKPSPLGPSNEEETRALLHDGLVSCVFATLQEACTLLSWDSARLSRTESCVWQVEEAAVELFQRYASLSIVMLFSVDGLVVRYKADDKGEVGLILPSRKIDVSRLEALKDPHTAKYEDEVSVVGAADSFFGAFAAACAHGRSIEQSLLWGYAAGQLNQLQPTAQLAGGREDLRKLLMLEYDNDVALVDAIFRSSTGDGATTHPLLQPRTFMLQNRLHLAALRIRPRELPFLVTGQWHGSAAQRASTSPRASSESVLMELSEVGRLLVQRDGLGYTPLQRAHELYSSTKKDTLKRLLARRVLDWLLYAHVLLVVTGDVAVVFNPLLEVSDLLDSKALAYKRADRERMQGAARAKASWARVQAAFSAGRLWRELVVRPPEEKTIFQKQMALIEQIDGHDSPSDVVDANCRLACRVIMSILHEIGNERKMRNRNDAAESSQYKEPSALERQIELHRDDLDSADDSVLQLVERVCLQRLQNGLQVLHAHVGSPDTEASRSTREMWDMMPPFCSALLRCRDPFKGRTLLLLAAGAGLSSIVELLLDYAEFGLVSVQSTTHDGSTALHEAAACQNAPICEMLLHRTRLPLDGPIANNLLQQTPLSGRKRDFQERLRKLVPSAAAYIVGIPDQTRGTPMSSEVTRNPRVAPTVR